MASCYPAAATGMIAIRKHVVPNSLGGGALAKGDSLNGKQLAAVGVARHQPPALLLDLHTESCFRLGDVLVLVLNANGSVGQQPPGLLDLQGEAQM